MRARDTNSAFGAEKRQQDRHNRASGLQTRGDFAGARETFDAHQAADRMLTGLGDTLRSRSRSVSPAGSAPK
jgi:hypothetical protein